MSPELHRAIAELADVISQMNDIDAACDLACERLTDALGGPVAILERSGHRWRLRAGAHAAPNDHHIADASVTSTELATRAASAQWAWVPLGANEDRVLLVPSGWQREHDALRLEEGIRQVGLALDTASLRGHVQQRLRTLRQTYRFSRRLSAVRGRAPLHQLIADESARAVRARLAALSLFREAESELYVAATVGYPRVLVQHVRVQPGEGVIGRVFQSARPLLVTDISKQPQLHRQRPRYKTPSFMAIPVMKGERPIGVICLTDREDGLPFDIEDLRTVRVLAGPASLALAADDLAQQAQLLGEWATVDPLTELFNRRYFRQRLEEEYQRARRYAVPLSLLLIDVDDFKRVNDHYGHPAGDTVLRAIADVLRRSVRAFDVCCRYGGEEFVLVLPGSDSSDALSTAQRVRQAIEGQPHPLRAGSAPLRVTVSIGSVTLDTGDTVDRLIDEADRALYEAKQRGKNQIRVARAR
jgi:diguanylate cyclase (GGDEF)-like protein